MGSWNSAAQRWSDVSTVTETAIRVRPRAAWGSHKFRHCPQREEFTPPYAHAGYPVHPATVGRVASLMANDPVGIEPALEFLTTVASVSSHLCERARYISTIGSSQFSAR